MSRISRVMGGMVGTFGCAITAHAGLLTIVDNLPGTFQDISRTGTALNLSGDLEAEIWTTIGNALLPAGLVVVGNNGAIGFNPPDFDLEPLNQMIPSENAFGGGQSLQIYWDNVGNDVGDVYWQEIGDILIIQWDNVHFADDPDRPQDTGRFQIQIFGGPTSIFSQFLYDDIEQQFPDGGASATIGYQSGLLLGPGNDVQWSFNQPGAVSDGTVLSLIPAPGSVALLGIGMLGFRRKRSARSLD